MFKFQLIGISFVILWNLYLGLTQDIGFPEEEPVQEFANKDKRKPVYLPGKCGANELLFPGDQKDDWICDCAGGFLYYPPNDNCNAAYRQGPCPQGEYLILKPGKATPECQKNPCKRDRFLQYNDLCYEIGTRGPCSPANEGYVIGVNATTLEIDCIMNHNELSLFKVPPKDCPPGSRRNTKGKCREES